jgi:type IV pilus assembly protein PilB
MPVAIDLTDEEAFASSQPVRKLIWLVLLLAVRDRATEVCFHPRRDHFRLCYRVNGVIRDMVPPPLPIAPRVANALKAMAGLDITRRRSIQRGLMRMAVQSHYVDVLVSTHPTELGEKVILDLIVPEEAAAPAMQHLKQFVSARRSTATKGESINEPGTTVS